MRDKLKNEEEERARKEKEMADKLKIELEEKAKKDAEIILQKAKKDIERDKEQALAVIRKNFAEITISAAEKVIDKSLDQKTHQDLIDGILNDYEFEKE